MTVDDQFSHRTKFVVNGLSEDDTSLLLRQSKAGQAETKLDVYSGQAAQQVIRVFNILCVAPILQFISSGDLASLLKPDAPWVKLTATDSSVPFGRCIKTDPKRPTEQWFFDEERGSWDRRSEPGASRKYYQALQAVPRPFEFWVHKNAGTLTVKVYPEVAAHHAAHSLIEGRGGPELDEQVDVSYRLSDISQQSDPMVQAFKVSNCDSETPTSVALKNPVSDFMHC